MEYKEIRCRNIDFECPKQQYKQGAFHFKDDISEMFVLNNKPYNENGPAVICYYSFENTKSFEVYYSDGQIHRENEPACIDYYRNGNILSKIYYIKGNRHRDDGPAAIRYDEHGDIKEEKYYLKGKVHRDDGPALITYSQKRVLKEIYYLNDKEVPKKTFDILTGDPNMMVEQDRILEEYSKRLIGKKLNKMQICQFINLVLNFEETINKKFKKHKT